MQLARDPLPTTVLMVNAMNTSAELSELLRQGDIPRLLKQELKERMPAKNRLKFHRNRLHPLSRLKNDRALTTNRTLPIPTLTAPKIQFPQRVRTVEKSERMLGTIPLRPHLR
jgi:hypothetical protein